MAVDFSVTGATFTHEKPRRWSDYRIPTEDLGAVYDLAPDGQHFVVLEPVKRSEQGPETHVNLLLNFFPEVRRRAPTGK